MPKPLPKAAGSTDQYVEAMAELEGWNLIPEAEMLAGMATDHIFQKDDNSGECEICLRPEYEHSLI